MEKIRTKRKKINFTLKPKVFVAMSGGVDSSVAALVLKRQGCNVVGVFMRCYNLDGCADKDAMDARLSAQKIGIPFYIWDFEDEYKRKVVEYMLDGYKNGITPNPDVECNREIKFGLFLERALEMGADYVATGHYVRKVSFSGGEAGLCGRRLSFAFSKPQSGKAGRQTAVVSDIFPKNKFCKFGLFEARDKNKDQSYFLWTLTQEKLRYCLFPIGNFLKSEVREIAREAGLPTADKKDSQGICFLGKVSLDEFLSRYLPPKQGVVLSVSGEEIGSHFGAHFYTVGQRHANILYNPKKMRPDMKPQYVVAKDIRSNTITVAEGDNNPALYKKEASLTSLNFVNCGVESLIRANKRIEVFARVRYRQPLFRAKLGKSETQESKSDIFTLAFEEPQKFVAPGQSAVFYSKEGELLGGGIIACAVQVQIDIDHLGL